MNSRLAKIIFLVFFMLGKFVLAQDSICLINHNVIYALVKEVNNKEIIYEMSDSPSEQHFEPKEKIAYIKYSNGLVEKFTDLKNVPSVEQYAEPNNKLIKLGSAYVYRNTKVNWNTAKQIMLASNNQKAIDLLDKSHKTALLANIGFAAIPAAIAGVSCWYNSIFKVYNPNGTINIKKQSHFRDWAGACAIITVACPTFSIYCDVKKRVYRKSAITVYNQSY